MQLVEYYAFGNSYPIIRDMRTQIGFLCEPKTGHHMLFRHVLLDLKYYRQHGKLETICSMECREELAKRTRPFSR